MGAVVEADETRKGNTMSKKGRPRSLNYADATAQIPSPRLSVPDVDFKGSFAATKPVVAITKKKAPLAIRHRKASRLDRLISENPNWV